MSYIRMMKDAEMDEEVNQEVLSDKLLAKCSIQHKSSHHHDNQATVGSPSSKCSIESDPNWQAKCKSVHERNALMCNSDFMSDVTFRVGPPNNVTRIPAHKYILATGSSVFYAMFYGGLADTRTGEDIQIPDVEPTAFLNLLRYLYYDHIDPEDDTVLATLYAAKKYIIPQLARECVHFLETRLCAKNACLLLSQSRLFEEHELMQRCWEVIDAQAEVALMSEGFTEIDFPTLEIILKRETLNSPEIVVFNAALRWAEAECVRQDLAPHPQNKRKVLKSALYFIRIPAMSLEDFANSPAQSQILTLEETTDIFLYFTAQQKPELRFYCRPRQGLQPQRCHRFQSCADRSNQWRYRGRCDSIQFCVDSRIFITGFGLYGSSNGPAEYQVKIELKNQRTGVVLGQNSTRFMSDGTRSCFPVYFKNPIQVEPDLYYIASATLDGSELSFFGQEGVAEVQVGNLSFQFQCSSDSTNGTGVQGGQIPELIFYR